ncbi:DUF2570 family protein [Serratia sp. Ag1]|uniref:DUF2570 family protein n=1 Tax=Serratia sp. Ag1 TaxID=1524467 RepID=UPI000500DC3F|nr:DUF2570 family protein [Serratia sp. Ag1]KFK98118.1 hypothetical protein IV04_14585 [Serratia sp. Ag1]
MSKYGLISLLLVAICLGWYASSLSGDLDSARQENKSLVAAVQSRDGTITALKDAASADRRATEEQLKIEQQKRAKADADNEKLRKALENNGCSNQRLPDDVRRILRREPEATTGPATDLRVPASSIDSAV